MQVTYMMLKPDAFETQSETTILTMLKEAGLTFDVNDPIVVDLEIMKHLIDHYGPNIESMDQSFDFPGKLFRSFYYDGPRLILPLRVSYEGAEDIIELTRSLVGSTEPIKADSKSIRGMTSTDSYALAGQENRLVANRIHASDSHESALRELAIWEAYL